MLSPQVYADIYSIQTPDSIPESIRVDAEELINVAAKIDNLILIDSRISDDRLEGYIYGSVSLPDIDTDCDTLSLFLETMQTHVAFYCNGPKCGRSGNAVMTALSCGYQNIYWFWGGFEEWQSKNYAFVKE